MPTAKPRFRAAKRFVKTLLSASAEYSSGWGAHSIAVPSRHGDAEEKRTGGREMNGPVICGTENAEDARALSQQHWFPLLFVHVLLADDDEEHANDCFERPWAEAAN
jgi:hypothetical protein